MRTESQGVMANISNYDNVVTIQNIIADNTQMVQNNNTDEHIYSEIENENYTSSNDVYENKKKMQQLKIIMMKILMNCLLILLI